MTGFDSVTKMGDSPLSGIASVPVTHAGNSIDANSRIFTALEDTVNRAYARLGLVPVAA